MIQAKPQLRLKKEEKAPEAEPKAEVKTEVKEAAKVETKTEEKPETKTEAPVAKENTEDGRIKASPLAKKLLRIKALASTLFQVADLKVASLKRCRRICSANKRSC